jgi:hypothetical protein
VRRRFITTIHFSFARNDAPGRGKNVSLAASIAAKSATEK